MAMKERYGIMKTFCGGALVVGFLLSFGSATAQIAIDTVPSSQNAPLGTTVAVDLVISGLGNFAPPSLGTFDIDVTFDPSILSFQNAAFGDQLDLIGLGSITQVAPGVMNVNIFELSLDDPADLDTLQPGSFTLATLTFATIASGTSFLEVIVNALGDAVGDPLTAETGKGTVRVVAGLEVADVITFEGFEAGARLSGVFGSRGSGPIFVQGTNPLLSTGINAAVVFDSACPPSGIPRDCTGGDSDLGTPNEAFGGPGVGSGGATSNDTALGKLLIIAEDVDDGSGDRLVDDPNDAGHGGTLLLDFSAVGTVIMHAITFVDLNHPDPTQKVDLFRGGVTGTLLATVPLPVTGNNGVSVVPLNIPGVDTVTVTLADSSAIDNITFTPESEPAVMISLAK